MQEQVNPAQDQVKQSQESKETKTTQRKSKSGKSQFQSGKSESGSLSSSMGDNNSGHTPISRQTGATYQAKQRPIQAKHKPVDKSHPSDLPNKLAHNIEQSTGVDMAGTKVIQNSKIPGQNGAEALAMNGKEIHLSRGGKKHLPEEAAHIARQRKGNLTPDTKMLAHGWSLNTNQQIEKEDRNIGAKAQNSPLMQTQYTPAQLKAPVQSSVMQRNPGKFDVFNQENLKDLGYAALTALLNERKQDIGAGVVNSLLSISLDALDSVGSAFIQTQMKTEGSAFSKISSLLKTAGTGMLKLRGWYNKIAGAKDLYTRFHLPILLAKYTIGRGLTKLCGAMGMSLPPTVLTKVMSIDTKLIDLFGWVEAIVSRVTNYLSYFERFKKMFEENEELKEQYSGKPVSTAFYMVWNNGGSKAVGAEGKSFGDWIMNTSGTVDTIGSVTVGTGLLVTTTGVGMMGLSTMTKSLDSKTASKVMLIGAGIALTGMAIKGAYNWYYGSGTKKEDEQSQQKLPEDELENNEKQELEKDQENEKGTEKDTEVIQSINTKFFWMELYKADIAEWVDGQTQKKTGGAQINFGMGLNLFGSPVASSKGHQVRLDWGGGFDYQATKEITIGKNIGFENGFNIGNASIDKLHINNKGLQKIDLSLTNIVIAGGAVTVENMGASWSEDTGFEFDADAKAFIAGHQVDGKANFGLDSDGNFKKGGFVIEDASSKPIDIIPGTLAVTASKFALNIDENKKLSGEVAAGAALTTDFIKFDSGLVTVKYDEGWSVKAPKISGSVQLPGQSKENAIKVDASVNYEKKQFSGDLKTSMKGPLDIIPGVVSLKSFNFNGKLDKAGKWGVTVAGQAGLATSFLDLDTGVLTFTYDKGGKWTLVAPGIAGKIKLPGGKTINVNANFSVINNKISGSLSAESLDTLEVIPDTLSMSNVSIKGAIDQKDGHWKIDVGGKVDVNSGVLTLDTGQVDFSYDNKAGWTLKAPEISGKIELPGGKVINIGAEIDLKSNKYKGKIAAEMPGKIEAIPGLLAAKDLGFKGELKDNSWAIGIWGGFDLTSKFLKVDADKIQFDYKKGGDWALTAEKIGMTLDLLGKQFKGTSSFALAKKKFSGSLDITTTDTFDIIPGILQIEGGKFAGAIKEDGSIKARLQSTLTTPDNQYMTVTASDAFLEYDSAKGDTFAQAWTAGIDLLEAGVFGNKVSLGLKGVNFSMQNKEVLVKKITLAFKNGGDQENLPDTSGGFDWGNIADILKIMKNFHVEASLDDIKLDKDGFHFGNKKPDWSLRELEMEYMGFNLKLTINDTEVTGSIGGSYQKDFNIFSLEMDVPVPAVPLLNLVGGINLVAKVDASANVGVTYDKTRSNSDDAFIKLDGGAKLAGGIYLEAVLGASVGVGNLVSLGGQLYGRIGADLSSKVDAGATLKYNRATRRIGPTGVDEERFRMRSDTEFSPTIELGGRLVFKVIGKKFNLFEYQFGKWNFGEGRMAFDVAPDETGRYSVVPDREVTHFNNKKFLQTNDIGKAINGIPEQSTIKKEYSNFREMFDQAEKSDSPKDRERLIEDMREEGPIVKERMFELMKMLVTRKEELTDGLKLLDDDDSHLDFLDRVKESYREYKKAKELKSELSDTREELADLQKEIKKVLLVNRNPEAAVLLLEQKRDKWTNIFSIKKFGIWDDLPDFIAEKEFEDINLDQHKLQETIELRSEEIRKSVKAEIDYRYEEILKEIRLAKGGHKEEENNGPRGKRGVDD